MAICFNTGKEHFKAVSFGWESFFGFLFCADKNSGNDFNETGLECAHRTAG